MDSVFKKALGNSLVWLPEKGWGYFDVKDSPYDQAYFDKYVAYSGTQLGKAILKARINLVDKYHERGHVVDIGVGCGVFYQTRPNTFGYDINPVAIEMLNKDGKFVDVYNRAVSSITCWDSFEHIKNSGLLLHHVIRFVFMSLPIFKNLDHLLKSKHLKKDEHCYYFTEDGLVSYMSEHDFDCVEHNTMETDAGRQDIGTFVFQRKL